MFHRTLEAASEGSFTRKDPIGFLGGQTNFYGYVMNMPLRFIDPFGLSPEDDVGGVVPTISPVDFLFGTLGYYAGKALIGAIGALESAGITIRSDVTLFGGRGGENVKNLSGPPNSCVKGGGPGRAFITDNLGNVIRDITENRSKPVIPGQGFGPKEPPSPGDLELLRRLFGR